MKIVPYSNSIALELSTKETLFFLLGWLALPEEIEKPKKSKKPASR